MIDTTDARSFLIEDGPDKKALRNASNQKNNSMLTFKIAPMRYKPSDPVAITNVKVEEMKRTGHAGVYIISGHIVTIEYFVYTPYTACYDINNRKGVIIFSE